MKSGIKFNFGDIVLTEVQFIDSPEIKRRPALVLFQEYGNIIVAGITSNKKMEGIKITQKEGMIKESVIKLNYIFTISEMMVKRNLFKISTEKKDMVRNELFLKIR
ncbi:MAG: type II toxin-antitoxin system PemK/MazF family toxin [Nanoarchaeota archaeon]|nr:type II toxin-antitoxin system PemK/MazF family toxin [Nanoarchaeota archaeon]